MSGSGSRFGGLLRRALGGSGGIDKSQIARVKALAVEVLALGEDVSLAVNEINCLDPGCPGIETVILVMAPGERTRALKVTKPIEQVAAQDIRAATEVG
ncbi:MAG: hypothetical protein EA385_08635 [Salinarimonadaceae bacterium]|nr:MAG: hypothetical protein EA385_08635 [Salinarimonadaceae bacterium]